jgi:MFS family permease
VRDLEGQARAAGTFLIARTAGFVLGNLAWQPIARIHGNRAIMVLGALLAGILGVSAAVIAILSPWKLAWISGTTAVVLLETLAFLGGATHSGLSVGFASLSIELAPAGERQAFVSLLNTFLGPTMLLPVLGGALLDATSAPVLFALCGILALAGVAAAAKLPGPREIAALRAASDRQ